MFYENPMVTTKQKTIVGSQKGKRGELEPTTTENHHFTKMSRKGVKYEKWKTAMRQ